MNNNLHSKILSFDTNNIISNEIGSFTFSNLEKITNVESIILSNIILPSNLYNISEYLQNNKLLIIDVSNNEHLIKLDDGYYNNTTLISSLLSKIQNITDFSNISINLNEINNKITFSNDNYFELTFISNNIVYNNCYNKDTKNLGNILGFNSNNIKSNNNIIESETNINIHIYNSIYMKIDKYNFGYKMNSTFSKPNSFLAKIPYIPYMYNSNNYLFITNDDITNTSYINNNNNSLNTTITIKFEYYNDIPVDFQNYNISFSLLLQLKHI